MPILAKEVLIPIYSLQESSRKGNALFEIVETKGEFQIRRVDFLVPHRKDYYLLVFVRNGSSRHWVDMTPYVLKPGTFYFTSPHQVHVKEKSQPLDGFILSFTDEFLKMEESASLFELPLIQNPANGHELVLKKEEAVFIEDLMKKMLDEAGGKKEWSHHVLMSYLRILLVYTSRLYTEQFQQPAVQKDRLLLKRFKDLIDEHFYELHLVSDYAQLLNISAGHLNDVVKEQSGKTAIEHIHERILLEAKRKLFYTDFSAKEIAWQLGFEDAAYFNRFFKRLADQTPAVFRSSTREMYH